MTISTIGTGTLTTSTNGSVAISLLSGQGYVLPQGGTFMVQPGPYTMVQQYEPVSQQWKNLTAPYQRQAVICPSDGTNYRIKNVSGTVVGAVVTNGGTADTTKNGIWPAGSSSVTGVTATVPAGGAAPAGTATFNCIVGGAVSTTVTVTSGGAAYTIPPLVEFSKPAPGGLQATGHAVLTAGVVTSIVVDNQGAGYPKGVNPIVTLTRAPGDTTGYGATATAILDAAEDGKLVAVTMNDNGGGYVAVPSITIAGLAGSPAATAIMCFTVVTATTVTGGTNYTNGAQVRYVAGHTAGSNTTTNPLYTTGLYQIRDGYQSLTTTAGGTGGVVIDGGLSQTDHSNACVIAFASDGTIPGATTFASGAPGGVVDTSTITAV